MAGAIPENSVTVNKIGGANMSQLDQVLNLVQVLKGQNEAPVLVVSAFQGVTNKLIAALDQLHEIEYDEATIEASITAAFKPAMDIINGKIDDFIKTEPCKRQAQEHLQREMDICMQVLKIHKKSIKTLAPDEQTYTTRDKIIAFGERSVIGILEAFLQENGIDAKAINDVTYKENGGKSSKGELHRGIQKGIAEALNPYKDTIDQQVLIIGGHVKNVLRGMVTEIGRSYTDTTAVDVTVALEKLLGISVDSTVAWKEVDGYLSGDPGQLDPEVNKPMVHHNISLRESMELAGSGSTLMQIEALALALENRIPLSLKNIKKPHEEGTTLRVGEVITGLPFKIITANRDIAIISCNIPEMANQSGFAAKLTEILAENGININDIITSNTIINFTVNLPKDAADRAAFTRRIEATIEQLKNIEIGGETHHCEVKQIENKANVVIIGDELKNATGVLNILTGVFAAEGINIDAIEHTKEQRKISFYVDQENAYKAVQALHRIFIDKDHDFAAVVAGEIEKNIGKFLGKDSKSFSLDEITANENVDIISCEIPQMAVQAGFAEKLTQAFADNSVSIDDIITSSTTINFTVNLPSDEKAKRELRKRIGKVNTQLRNIEINGEIHQCNPDWDQSKTNLVITGEQLKDNTGVLNVLTGVLAAEGINIDAIEHTIEQNKISFYVDKKDADRAVEALHRVFIDKDRGFAKQIIGRIRNNINRFLN
ncbi:MAG: ACT domain-containing protein [Candidatus Gracilibacteria bacterium]|jgi:aspartate kinase